MPDLKSPASLVTIYYNNSLYSWQLNYKQHLSTITYICLEDVLASLRISRAVPVNPVHISQNGGA